MHPSTRIGFANFLFMSKWKQFALFTVAAGVHNVGPDCSSTSTDTVWQLMLLYANKNPFDAYDKKVH